VLGSYSYCKTIRLLRLHQHQNTYIARFNSLTW